MIASTHMTPPDSSRCASHPSVRRAVGRRAGSTIRSDAASAPTRYSCCSAQVQASGVQLVPPPRVSGGRKPHWLWYSASSGRPWLRRQASYVMLCSAGTLSPGPRPAVGQSTSSRPRAGARLNRHAATLVTCAYSQHCQLSIAVCTLRVQGPCSVRGWCADGGAATEARATGTCWQLNASDHARSTRPSKSGRRCLSTAGALRCVLPARSCCQRRR